MNAQKKSRGAMGQKLIFQELSYEEIRKQINPSDPDACIQILDIYIKKYEEKVNDYLDLPDNHIGVLVAQTFVKIRSILDKKKEEERADTYAISGLLFMLRQFIELARYANEVVLHQKMRA